MHIRVKKCSEKELKDLFQIETRANRIYKEILKNYKEPLIPFKELKNDYKSGVNFYTAIVSRVKVGFIGYKKIDNMALVRGLFILPRFQHSGVGSKLITFIEEKAKAEKADKLMLLAHKKAYWAVNFYRKNKFRANNRNKHNLIIKFWGLPPEHIQELLDKENLTVMEKKL